MAALPSMNSRDKSEHRRPVPQEWEEPNGDSALSKNERPEPISTQTDLSVGIVTLARMQEALREFRAIQRSVAKFNNEQGKVKRDLKDIADSVAVQSTTITTNDEKLKQLDGQTKNDKLQSIQILALFVAFFTFVSVEFQLFANMQNWQQVAGLSLVLLGALLIFVCLTYLGLAYYYSKESEKPASLTFNQGFLLCLSVLSMLLVGCGIFLGYKGIDQHKKDCDQKEKRISQVLESDNVSSAEFLKENYYRECGD